MYELTTEELASIPFDGMDHEVCNRLVRIAASAKVKTWPEAFTASEKGKPAVNIRHKKGGVIIGGEIGFYYNDFFIFIFYSRDHSVDRDRYLLNAGDGMMRITKISVGASPKPLNNRSIRGLGSTDSEWLDFIDAWRDAEFRSIHNTLQSKGKSNDHTNRK